MSTNIGQSFSLTVNSGFTHKSSWTSSGNSLFHYIFPFCRVATRPDWSMAPLQPPPPTASRQKRRRRRSSPLTSTSIWSQTCWSLSALRPVWLDRHLTCCRVWVYTCHPTLIPHKGQEMDLGNNRGDIWREPTHRKARLQAPLHWRYFCWPALFIVNKQGYVYIQWFSSKCIMCTVNTFGAWNVLNLPCL